MTVSVDSYLSEGCGRCSRYQTPACNVHKWQPILRELRHLALASGLTETIKWGNPTYLLEGKNVCIIGAFNNDCVLSFFKGALLHDPKGLLQKSGTDSQAGRVIRFTLINQLIENEEAILELIANAMCVEAQGLVPQVNKELPAYPAELLEAFALAPDFKMAFESLTRGRQRGYLLHFNQAKQPTTRARRIEKHKPQIFLGKGPNE